MVAASARWMLALLSLLSLVTCEEVFQKGRSKFTLEALETSCDGKFVEYFRRVPDTESLYTFRVLKLAAAFSIDIAVRVRKTKRVMYKVDNVDGCQFLENPLMNRIFGSVYKRLIVNGSLFSCPIQPRVYFLKNEGSLAMLPSFHPAGRYQVTMRVRMPNSGDPFVMQMLWIYNIVHIK